MQVTEHEQPEDNAISIYSAASASPVWVRWVGGLLLVITALLAVLAIQMRVDYILTQSWPLDLDGFYYLQELQSRSRFGQGYYHDHSVFFWLFAQLHNVFNLSHMGTYQVWVLGSTALMSLGLFGLAWPVASPQLKEGSLFGRPFWQWASALMLSIWPWVSDISWYLHYGYLKQSAAWALLCCAAPLWLHGVWHVDLHLLGAKHDSKLERLFCLPWFGYVSIVILLLAASLHASATVVACFILVVPFLGRSLGHRFLVVMRNPQRFLWMFIGLGIAILLALSSLWVLDKTTLLGQMGLQKQWIWQALLARKIIGYKELVEAAMFNVLGASLCFCVVAAGFVWRASSTRQSAQQKGTIGFWFLCSSLLVLWLLWVLPIWDMGPNLPAYRLARSSVWLLWLVLGCLLCWQANEGKYQKTVDKQLHVEMKQRMNLREGHGLRLVVVLAFSISALLFLQLPQQHRVGLREPFVPTWLEAARIKRLLPEGAVVVAPHGAQFALTYFTQVPALKGFPKQREQLYHLHRHHKKEISCQTHQCLWMNGFWMLSKL